MCNSRICNYSIPADLDEIITLAILGGLLLVPIITIFSLEFKDLKLETDLIKTGNRK